MTERRRSDLRTDKVDRLLTDEQVAKMARVSVRTVHQWRLTGQLPFVKMGRRPRVRLSLFLRVFQNPLSLGMGGADTMPLAEGDIRRRSRAT